MTPRLAALLLLAALPAALGGCDTSPYRTVVVETGQRRAAPPAPPAPPAASRPALRLSVAAIQSPRDTFPAHTRLFERLGQLLGRRVELVQRRTYREVNDLLISGDLDVALICTGGLLDLVRRAPRAVEVVAVPVVRGEASYRSAIVVPAASAARDVRDLAGARFAFTDELSFSGHLWAEKLLRERGLDPERHFGAVTYTGSHDRSIDAVAAGLVDGAAVHGGVLAEMEERDPSLRARVRVLHRSPPVGGMPVVVSTRLDPEERERLHLALLDLDHDPEAAAALAALRIDRFTTPAPGFYASASRLLERP